MRMRRSKTPSQSCCHIGASWRETEWLPTATFDRIAEFFAAGREAVGVYFEIAVDCHGRLNPADAIRLCEALAPFKKGAATGGEAAGGGATGGGAS